MLEAGTRFFFSRTSDSNIAEKMAAITPCLNSLHENCRTDKTGKLSFCVTKIFGLSDSCPATLFNCQTLIIDTFFIFFFKFHLLLPSHFLDKKALKQYYLNTEIIFSNPVVIS